MIGDFEPVVEYVTFRSRLEKRKWCSLQEEEVVVEKKWKYVQKTLVEGEVL